MTRDWGSDGPVQLFVDNREWRRRLNISERRLFARDRRSRDLQFWNMLVRSHPIRSLWGGRLEVPERMSSGRDHGSLLLETLWRHRLAGMLRNRVLGSSIDGLGREAAVVLARVDFDLGCKRKAEAQVRVGKLLGT